MIIHKKIIGEQSETIEEDEKQNILNEVQEIAKTQTLKVEEYKDSIVHLSPSKLVPIENQPFDEYTDEERESLINSIRVNGILYPIIVRPYKDGIFQILAGRHRNEAAIELNLPTVPCIIKEADDDMAKIIMVETNIVQRKNMSVMSLAKAYKIQADAYKHKNIDIRKKGEKIKDGDKVADKLSSNGDLAYRTISRYIKLNNLIPEFHELVNNKKIQIKVASVIASLSATVQRKIYGLIKEDGMKFNEKQISAIKKAEEELGRAAITTEHIVDMFSEKNKKPSKTTISFTEEEISKYFGEEYLGNTSKLKELILNTFGGDA